MARDWDHRTFSEMASSTGDGEKTPFEIPLVVQISRTDDRRWPTSTGTATQQGDRGTTGSGTTTTGQQRTPYDVPSNPSSTANPNGIQNGRGGNWDAPPLNNGNGQFRSPYGGVAAPALDATNPTRPLTPSGDGQWRSPYGGVAQPALDATNPARQTQGPDGQWRSPYGGVAPPARDLPPMNNGAGRDPNSNGGATIPGDPGRWQPGNGGSPGNGAGLDQTGRPAGAGTDPMPALGYNWNAGIAVPSDQQKKDIDQSLHTHFNYFTHFVEGGVGGLLGSSVIPWAGDKLMWQPKLDGYRLVEYYRSGHSPLGLQLRSMDGNVAELTQNAAEFQTHLSEAQTQYRESLRELAGTRATGTQAATGRAAIRETQRAAAEEFAKDPTNIAIGKKAQLMDDLLKSRPATPEEFTTLRTRIDSARLPSDATPITEGSYLTAAEAQLLKGSLNQYRTMLGNKTVVDGIAEQVGHNRQQLEAMEASRAAVRERGGDFNWRGTNKTWQDNVRPGAGKLETELTTWRGDSKMRAMGEGLAVASAGLVVNYAVDKYMPNMFGLVGGHDAKPEDHFRSYLQGPIIAAALLAPNKSTLWKISAAGLTTAGVGIAEKFFPEKADGNYSKLMQPNWIDGVGMPAAWMMPFGSWKNRAIAVATTYAVARGADFLNNVVGVHVPGMESQDFAVGMASDAAEAIASKKVTSGSFNDIQKSNFKLGMENEGALLGNLGAVMNDTTQDPLYHLHASAAMYTALGQVYDERGTRIKAGTLNDQGRILAGAHYDLGGQATDFYRQAVTNLVEGQNQAKAKGNSDAASAMADAQKEVQRLLDKEYAQHDIGDVYGKLQKEFQQDIDGMGHFQVTLRNQVVGLQTRDTAYAAKMCRDLVLLDLAIATVQQQKNNGGDASVMYAEALQFLDSAQRIDGQNPDYKQLRQIADGLKAKIPVATQNQYNNRFNNPYGVPNTGTGG